MQSVPSKEKIDDSESQFDFLNVDENRPARESANSVRQHRVRHERPESVSNSMKPSNSSKPFPVIRKPVSVAQTGPLRPPRPGDPVEPPPPLTDGIRSAPEHGAHRSKTTADLDELDLDLDDDDWPSSDHWADNLHRSHTDYYEEAGTGVWRKLGYVVAALLILAGTLAALYSNAPVRQWVDTTVAGFMEKGAIENSDTAALVKPITPEGVMNIDDGALDDGSGIAVFDPDAPALEPSTELAINPDAPKSLNTLFREELARLEVLLDQGKLQEAESVLQTMDRAVYGYGAPEFTEIKERIAAGSQDSNAEEAALLEAQRAEQQRAEEEARIAEEQRLAAENQARAEAEAALEAERQREAAAEAELAARQAREQQSTAANAVQPTSPSANPAPEDAAALQLRADRIAQEQARQEQLALARQQRDLFEQQQRAAQLQLEATAVDSQQESIEDIAAGQRQAAREQRLAEIGQQVDLTDTELQVDTGIDVSLAETSDTQAAEQSPQSAPAAITDADLQLVYGQFSQLESAIENRDVNAVIQLTERSGARIQQIMQMFENNVSIEAQLQNVSTLDARGEIQGTLRITRLVRDDGSVTGPPLNLGSVRLSSVRDGDGWSSIRW